VSACHCTMCRSWSAGPYVGLHHKGPMRFEGQDHVGVYKSSTWAQRGFCKKCGSNLFYQLSEEEYSFSTGLFDDQDLLKLNMQYFIDEKPDHYELGNETKTLTGAEIFEMFAPKADE